MSAMTSEDGAGAEQLVNLLVLVQEGIGYVVTLYSRIAPKWLRDWKIQDDWAEVTHVFPEELTVKQRFLNDPEVIRNTGVHGFVEPYLGSKIAFLKKATDRYRDLAEKQSTRIEVIRTASYWYLAVIDAYLRPLISVFPALAAVKDFKEQLKLVIEAPQELG